MLGWRCTRTGCWLLHGCRLGPATLLFLLLSDSRGERSHLLHLANERDELIGLWRPHLELVRANEKGCRSLAERQRPSTRGEGEGHVKAALVVFTSTIQS